jgi:hypothetical protein
VHSDILVFEDVEMLVDVQADLPVARTRTSGRHDKSAAISNVSNRMVFANLYDCSIEYQPVD